MLSSPLSNQKASRRSHKRSVSHLTAIIEGSRIKLSIHGQHSEDVKNPLNWSHQKSAHKELSKTAMSGLYSRSHSRNALFSRAMNRSTDCFAVEDNRVRLAFDQKLGILNDYNLPHHECLKEDFGVRQAVHEKTSELDVGFRGLYQPSMLKERPRGRFRSSVLTSQGLHKFKMKAGKYEFWEIPIEVDRLKMEIGRES